MNDFNEGQVVYHAQYGTGRVMNVQAELVIVNFIKAGIKYFKKSESEELSDVPFEREEGEDKDMDIDAGDLKEAMRQVLREEGIIGEPPIAEKWQGGEMILKPGKEGLQEKSIPIENFFHKIIMLRDRLRVLEQNINSSDKLSEVDKLNLQQYITRCYGSLTTFNVLFAEKNDWFVGEKSK